MTTPTIVLTDHLNAISTELRRRGLNDEVCVYFMEGKFKVSACNPSRSVAIGESEGVFESSSACLDEAVLDVLRQIRSTFHAMHKIGNI